LAEPADVAGELLDVPIGGLVQQVSFGSGERIALPSVRLWFGARRLSLSRLIISRAG
jgi:hypothetical protein